VSEGTQHVTLVSFKRDAFKLYLAASASSLLPMFDFTLLRHQRFPGWSDGAEDVVNESHNFFYRQKIAAGHAAYTRGVQIVRPRRSQPEIFSLMRDHRFGREAHGYVEFIACD
jgi:hypothetical protein